MKRESEIPPCAESEAEEGREGETGTPKEIAQAAALRKLGGKYLTVKGDLMKRDAAFLRECERRMGGSPSLKEVELVLETIGADREATKRECMLALWLRRILGAEGKP